MHRIVLSNLYLMSNYSWRCVLSNVELLYCILFYHYCVLINISTATCTWLHLTANKKEIWWWRWDIETVYDPIAWVFVVNKFCYIPKRTVIMEDNVDVKLCETTVNNPAYSSSSLAPFSFQELRQAESGEDTFARARSRPDPRIISHALAGKIFTSRDLATRLSGKARNFTCCVTSRHVTTLYLAQAYWYRKKSYVLCCRCCTASAT